MEIRTYYNLTEDLDKVIALKRKEEFEPENGIYGSVLNNYKMLEFFSSNISLNEEVIDKVLQKEVGDYLNSYCFFISDADYKTRIRSYKGYINAKFKNCIVKYKEWEIDFEKNMSFFIGIINLKPNYQNIFDSLFFDSSRCFVFCTNELVEEETLINKVLTDKGIANLVFNYYYLIQSFIHKDELIIRAAGSDIENGVQVFARKENSFY